MKFLTQERLQVPSTSHNENLQGKEELHSQQGSLNVTYTIIHRALLEGMVNMIFLSFCAVRRVPLTSILTANMICIL